MKRKHDDTGITATMNPPQGVRDDDQFGKSGVDMEEMTKRAEAAGKPGPGHKALEHYLGSWKAEVKCWAEPGGPANVSEATANISWTMSGRFLQEDF